LQLQTHLKNFLSESENYLNSHKNLCGANVGGKIDQTLSPYQISKESLEHKDCYEHFNNFLKEIFVWKKKSLEPQW
jgi:hypothetical protein